MARKEREPNPPRCDGEKSVAFLRKMLPDALWSITAIWPQGIEGMPVHGKVIHTKTFSPDEGEECRAWIEKMNNAGWNIYFMPNPPKERLSRKAKKEDVKEVRYFYVDLDPKKTGDLQAEREKISQLISQTIDAGKVPTPTAIVDSGGGYWVFWALETPLLLKKES